jgi:SAM-dependent methyltransferase
MRLIAQGAALARIAEVAPARRPPDGRTTMTATDIKSATRAMWAAGDYHRFATETVWELGPRLVEAAGITTGQRVLDVACGTGNVAIRAAEAGALVVASDVTPEHFEAGRDEARRHEVELQWIEADAEDLPFADGEFDVVTSSLGAIFAPSHQRVADELLRVCRPGGTIAMLNFTPEGLAGEFFGTLGPYMPPPPPGALPPLLWGSEEHVRDLLGEGVASLAMTRDSYVERAASPRDYVELFTQTFGPAVAIRGALANQPERAAAFEHDFLEFAARANTGDPGGRAEYRYEYLLVIARKQAR